MLSLIKALCLFGSRERDALSHAVSSNNITDTMGAYSMPHDMRTQFAVSLYCCDYIHSTISQCIHLKWDSGIISKSGKLHIGRFFFKSWAHMIICQNVHASYWCEIWQVARQPCEWRTRWKPCAFETWKFLMAGSFILYQTGIDTLPLSNIVMSCKFTLTLPVDCKLWTKYAINTVLSNIIEV